MIVFMLTLRRLKIQILSKIVGKQWQRPPVYSTEGVPLNNPSGHESDGCTSKRFKIVSEEENYRWSLLADMTEYANENLEKFIPDKDVKEAILLKLPRPKNIDPVKKLDDFLLELLTQKKKTVDITIDDTSEKIQDKAIDIMGPLSKL